MTRAWRSVLAREPEDLGLGVQDVLEERDEDAQVVAQKLPEKQERAAKLRERIRLAFDEDGEAREELSVDLAQEDAREALPVLEVIVKHAEIHARLVRDLADAQGGSRHGGRAPCPRRS